MIYTVTLNPCLDRFLIVEDFKPDDANRIQEEHRFAAGKGIDVSRVIAELGGDSIALGFVGGFGGLELEGRLINAGVQCDFTRISRETRINIHVYNKRSNEQTSFNAPGPEVKPAELAAFCTRIRKLSPSPSFVAFCGSVPRGVTKNIYKQIGLWAREQGARIVLDTDRDAFREGIKCQPFLVKPNIHEMSRYFDEDLSDAAADILIDRAHRLIERGVELVLLSMGADGLLCVSTERLLRVIPPKVEARSTIGSGDSVVAGVLHALSRGDSLADALRLGAACGAATAMTPGTELCYRDDIEALLDQVKVEGV